MSDYENMSRAELVHRLLALEQLDSERRLTEAEERVHLIQSVVEQGFSAVLITGGELPDPRVVYINPALAKATGYSAQKVVGQPLSALANSTSVQDRLCAGMPRGERFVEEVSTYQTAGGERWGEWRVGPVKDKRGQNAHWLVIFRDITERKRLEKEILEISDRERQRIGQDLHDGLCQHLAGIELMSQVLEQQLAPKSKAAAARAGDIARHVREGISQTRALARGLSPVTLESEGLMSALRELAASMENMFAVKCRLVCDPPVVFKDPVTATHLYRIAQEAVSNAIKHGKAGEVVLQLQTKGGQTRLSVRDNGVGFPKAIPKQKGMGLRIMQSRAGLIGGSLTIEKGPAGSTTVLCTVPVGA